MATPMFLDNPDYRDSSRFILEGHERLARGESSLPKTDEEHDRMTEAWSDLSAAEKARLKGLSADLYMLRDKEVVAKADGATCDIEGLEQRLATAVQEKKSDELLALLRLSPSFLTRDQNAFLRGLAWQNLGHDDVALLFFDYAGKLKPRDERAQLLQLCALLKLGRIEEARRRSEVYASAAVTSMDSTFSAAG